MATEDSGNKTWIGSVAAAIVSAIALALIGIPVTAVVCGAVAASSLERWPGPFNDNLVVAPGVALAVWLTT